jgi:hypothetical protein
MSNNLENPKHKKEFINGYGEKMTMILCVDNNMFIHHNDCNDDFEKASIFMLKYILDDKEKKALNDFFTECENILKNE